MRQAASRLANNDSNDRGSSGDNIGERTGRLGLEIADVTGIVDSLAAVGGAQIEQLRSVVAAARDVASCNTALATAMEEARTAAELARSILSESADAVGQTLSRSIETMESLSEGVLSTTDNLTTVRDTIEKVRGNSTAIQSIAFETRLIAFNARIEAARAGDAGQSFAVIANSIKALADQVSAISTNNHNDLSNLQRTLDALLARSFDNLTTARSAASEANNAKETSHKLQSLVSGVHDLTSKIETMTDPVQQNIESGNAMRENLRSLVTLSKDAETNLAHARERAQSILGISEDFMLFVVQSGIETPDSSILTLCQETAAQICTLFESAIDQGRITISDLFDDTYRPIAGTNPEQVLTRFTSFTDEVLPAIQEPVLSKDSRIAFCAAVDRNGYLPTHNIVYSKSQGDDPAWNAANSRNRRIFNDRTGLSAGRNQRPFLLQTYRRDMGNGTYILMKDASAPISVRGRHWGGFRIGFRV